MSAGFETARKIQKKKKDFSPTYKRITNNSGKD